MTRLPKALVDRVRNDSWEISKAVSPMGSHIPFLIYFGDLTKREGFQLSGKVKHLLIVYLLSLPGLV